MNTEEVVGLVLGALHPRLRERCSEAKILSVLDDDCGAYDVEALRSLLETRQNFARLRRALGATARGPALRNWAALSQPASF